MKNEEIWIAVTRTANDLAGVFEFDGETGYFYFYNAESERIIDWIHIVSGMPDFRQADVKICWAKDEAIVGLFIHSKLWAAFDAKHHNKFGGNYQSHKHAEIPAEVNAAFRQM